ncbi:hypothetical protein ENSA5_41760 [Enhygromyxa salina]|uniref:YHYH domain-containing protein n=1 Tax=Enhygromyxa salina TaxID=215803 RepID=A0A2S9XMF7_9BACT|nr:hypothetical protein ENSA5_41760 [Enhygromyxa salina]
MKPEFLLAPALSLLFPLAACTPDGEASDLADSADSETGAEGDPDAGTSEGTDEGTDEGTSDGTDDDGTDDDGSTDDGCPDENFPPVSADPANGAYPDPFLDVYCEDDEVIVESNGIPAYEFVELTPNPLDEQDWRWHFPRNPELAAQTTEVPLLGPAGTAVNGLPFYGPNEGPVPDPFGDPIYNQLVDFCAGHTGGANDYHYHTLLIECLTSAVGPDEPSPVIGYAFDGFPIYGSMGCLDDDCDEVVEFSSGWVQTGDPSTYAWDNHEYQASDDPTVLDPCNGRVGPDGDYRYHVTASFPYILGCYAGTPTDNPREMPGEMPGEMP